VSARIDDDTQFVRGTRPTRAAEKISDFQAGRPKRPRYLNPVAVEKWNEMVRLLSKRGTLTKMDGSALEIFCETYARWRVCVDDVIERGPVVEDEIVNQKTGAVTTRRVENPSAKLAIRMESNLRQMLSSFAATPVSRETARRVAPPKSKEPEPGTVGWYEKHPELCTDMLPDTLEVTQHESATEGNSPAVDAEICDGIVDVGDIDANDFTA